MIHIYGVKNTVVITKSIYTSKKWKPAFSISFLNKLLGIPLLWIFTYVQRILGKILTTVKPNLQAHSETT